MTGSTLDLQGRLASVLDFLEQSAKQAGQFAVDQAPDVIREILVWNLYRAIILGVIFVCILIPLIVLWQRHLKFCIKEMDGDWWVAFGFCHFAYLPIAGLFLIGILNHIMTATKILIAPKLYLIEYAATLLK